MTSKPEPKLIQRVIRGQHNGVTYELGYDPKMAPFRLVSLHKTPGGDPELQQVMTLPAIVLLDLARKLKAEMEPHNESRHTADNESRDNAPTPQKVWVSTLSDDVVGVHATKADAVEEHDDGWNSHDERDAFVFAGKVYLLDEYDPGPFPMGVNLRKAKEVALAKLTHEEKVLLGLLKG